MVRTRSGGEVVVRRAGGGARKRAALAEIEENVPKRTRGKKGESIPTTDDVVARDGGKSMQDGGEGSGKRGGDVGVDNPRESAKNVAAKTEKNNVPSKKTKRKASQKRKKPKKTQQEEEEQNVDSAEPASAVLLHGTRRPSFGGSSDDSSQNKIVITYSKKTQRESRRPLTTHLRAIRRKSSIRKRRSSVGSGTVDGGDDELFEPESEEDGSPEGKESARMEKFLAQQRRIWDEIDNYELEET
uniref:Uncharacterized protein n=1 Tax=Rhodosorus marinus TaxID=101924 RepID=A0A7S2ZLK0_9RHOD|mmetsp:Transcript_23343/g.92864  ORF Transcript_23343/g.92864 Transcript_23343/m.92864 type:complete len:243 (+) Transcript_23343:209-937(+)|eukprot:CAMPEP_0113963382 /NCGR_PEP_ID=MMETSP0011_2-20120614/6479_1 /TAXON_ID=101924 /ORGANISM="Rhodosorus marinus" /LENGTH=242 /DNA_ID=CAMNT_0000975419 /DNA_START=118 /DNA_END=846 /DNA_ORIENTATION=- /assembly_acc=CAM_ASM_000156